METLEFYFEQCAIAMTCDHLSIVAATLANGGICPITNQRIFNPEHVRNCLSLMLSCGMYDSRYVVVVVLIESYTFVN